MKNSRLKAKSATFKITLTAVLFAITLVLSLVENMLPPVIIGVPGLRLGLSNIIVMFCIFYLDSTLAIFIAVLKSFFVFLMRGFVAAVLSLCGGVVSAVLMIILIAIFKDKISIFLLSVLGAITHNFFQIVAIMIIMQNFYFIFYTPVLVIFGIVSGTITATILNQINKNLKIKELLK
ncbi:MAG: Gx transporter family protein [Clostridia bacterium]